MKNRSTRNPGFPADQRPKFQPLQIFPSGKVNLTGTTSCSDSSGRFFLQRTDSVNFYVGDSYRTADGKLLVVGEYSKYFPSGPLSEKGFMMKCDDDGNVSWMHLYDSLNHVSYSYFNYYKVIELQDGSILMAGSTNNLLTSNDDLVLTKTDSQGNIIWSKIYKSRIWLNGSNGSGDYFYVQQMKQDPYTGDIYITGPHWDVGKNITKFDQANGNILWSNIYQPKYNPMFDRAFGIDILPNEIRSFGTFYTGYKTMVSIYRINKTTGDTIQSKFFKVADSVDARLSFLNTDPLKKLSNGSYALSGECLGYYLSNPTEPYYQSAVAIIDSNLNFVNAYCIRNSIPSNSYNTHTTVYPDGSGLFTMLYFISGFTADVYYLQFNNGTILKERKKHYVGEGYPSVHDAIRTADGGDLMIRLMGDSATNVNKIEFVKLHVTDTSSNCLGVDDPVSFIQPFNYYPVSWPLDSIPHNDFLENPNKTLTLQNITSSYLAGCQSTASCNNLDLTSSADTVCTTTSLTLTVHKNPGCGVSPLFNYDPTHVQSFTQVNDSTFSVVFNSSWQGNIYASISGCTVLSDSVHVVVFAAQPNVNLGPDSSICPGNTVVLNAGAGYASYHWSTGAVTSSIAVNAPGTYYIDVLDGCGHASTDTIVVNPATAASISIGPDRIKCNADTLHLNAPAGFLNYTWGPSYNINPQTGPNVVVQPLMDTLYFVKAEKTTGCFSFDTVHITVNHSPVIDLGPDKNICAGDSTIADAGPGFTQYTWSGGAITQKISIFSSGTYFVTGITAQGCTSTDTFNVTRLSLPTVNLNKDSSICTGDPKILDAGAGFTSYSWNTGAITRTISVSSLGIYWVVVRDANNCIGTDTTMINKYLSSPSKFLPADTIICNFSTIQISAQGNYNKYLWNTGAVVPALTISTPGLYWLTVTDNNNCKGRDSIMIDPKDCLKGFYIPSAFVPGKSGANGSFKPFLFGNLKQYRFLIYNRLGQLVFSATDVNAGWNGKVKDVKTDNAAFVWICTYQFEGEEMHTEKGTVLMIR